MSICVRFRIDLGSCSLGPGKVALLEAIERLGSLSKAARTLGMSYRHAWLLMDSVNHAFPVPAAVLSVGGKGGGGAMITDFGRRLVQRYRQFETQIDEQAGTMFHELIDLLGDTPAPTRAARREGTRAARAARVTVARVRAAPKRARR